MVTQKDIAKAHARIRLHILNTELLRSDHLSTLNGGNVYLKLESEQHTGSFKARGALNKVLQLTDDVPLVTASTGNHAQGFARALTIAGRTGTIYMPVNADKGKIAKLEHYDITIEFHGTNSLEAELHGKSEAEKHGALWISPYNDEDIIAGQGTVGKEIQEAHEMDVVMACIGGGGLMSGVSTWFKAISPETKMIGCLPQNSPEMYLSVKEGRVVFLPEYIDTLSDGSAGGLEQDAITFDICRELVDDYVLVTEEEIASAIKLIYDEHGKVIEGAAGVAVGAFIKRAADLQGKDVAIIICGGNINEETLNDIL